MVLATRIAAVRARNGNSSRAAFAAGVILAQALACGRGGGGASGQAPARPVGDSPVVARLNGEPIEIADLRAGFPGALRADRSQALEAAVARRLAAQEARRRGLDTADRVRAQVDALRRDAAAREEGLLRDALQASLESQISVTEDELRARYEQTKARFTERRLRLRRAVFPTAEAARAEDQKLGADGRLDPASSEEIGPLPVQKLFQAQWFGAMRLREPGQRVVVDREGKFALVELEEVLPPAPLPFEEVREQLEHEVRSQRGGEALAKLAQELRAAAHLEVDEAVLEDDAAWQRAAGERGPLRQPRR